MIVKTTDHSCNQQPTVWKSGVYSADSGKSKHDSENEAKLIERERIYIYVEIWDKIGLVSDCDLEGSMTPRYNNPWDIAMLSMTQ
jgi:hypothetical protein